MLLDIDGSQPWSIQDRDQGYLQQGLWVHLASTWDGTTIRHYLNGVPLAETATFTGPVNASTAALIIGANVPYNNTAFKGALDDLRLTWACAPGANYVVQTNAQLNAGSFADLTTLIPVPADYSDFTTNYLHRGGLTNAAALYYRIKLQP